MTTTKFSTEEQGSVFQERKRLWLKAAVEASGQTQVDIAAAMGISPSNLSALVNGHKSITDATMDKAANAMNLELPDLGLKIQLPAPAPQAGLTITKEMWDELVSQNKRVMRLVDHLLDQPKR